MNKLFSGWLDLMVRTFIVVFVSYLALSAFFISDLRKMNDLMVLVEAKINEVEKQGKFLSSVFTPTNPEVLYHIALQDEQNGDLNSAAQKLLMAIRITETNNQMLKSKLQDLASRVGQ